MTLMTILVWVSMAITQIYSVATNPSVIKLL